MYEGLRRHREAPRMILVGASVNVETSGNDGEVPSDMVGRKLLAREINLVRSTERGEVYRIVRDDGMSLDLPIDNPQVFGAGSSLNVTRALRAFGCDGNIGVIAPFGQDAAGRRLGAELDRVGVRLYRLDGGEKTSFTLTLRSRSGERDSTMFCVKSAYRTPTEEELVELLDQRRPWLVLLTSTKVADLALAELLAARSENFVLMPHRELLAREDLRPRVRALAKRAEFVQINEHEASVLIGRTFRDSDKFEVYEMMGAAVLIITLAERGALYLAPQLTVAEGARPVRALVDSSGAGDTHFAAFTYYHILLGAPPSKALSMAAEIAARTVEQVGPGSGIPAKGELEEMLGPRFRDEWP
jgi:sugar/nucleoside kinase (ribokinase family)